MSLLFLSTLLAAQEVPDPFRCVPEDAAIVLRTVGVAGLDHAFAATRWWQTYKQVAVDPSTRALWQELRASFPEHLPAKRADLLEGLAHTLGGHRGEIVFGLTVRPRTPDERDTDPVGVVVSLRIAGTDAEFDELERIAAGLLPEQATETKVAGQTFRLHAFGGQQCTAPQRLDGALVMFFGSDLERGIEHCLTATPYQPDPALTRVPFALQIESAPLLRLLQAPSVAAKVPEVLPDLLRQLDIEAVQRLRWTSYADGPWVAIDTEFGTQRAVPLLASWLAPRSSPDLVTVLPPTARTWSTMSIDWMAVWSIASKLADRFADQLPATREELLTKFTEATKLDLENDLIALLGNQILWIDDLAAFDPDAEEPEDPGHAKIVERFGERCYVLQLRSGAKFGANLDKLLRARGLHAARKREEYGNARIYRLTVLGVLPLEYAIVDDLLVVGVGGGEGTGTNLRGVLDAALKPPAERNAIAMPAAVAEAMQGWPGGWSSVDVTSSLEGFEGLMSIADYMRLLFTEAPEAAEEFGGEELFGKLHAWMVGVRKAVKASGVDLQVEAGWVSPAGARYRARM